ncbi:hypothetical protein LWI29_013061 [Acer saccharum]|uniref:Chromo domain-containing protein n=1 Tax=Acer saccharum TaxID=4024 RepID=A0AA39RCE6_ACESA|nr:hypothetical protein LWI29_013061 [Acer saccharum]
MDDGFEEDARLDRRPCDRRSIYGQRRELWRGAAEYEGDRRKERHHSQGPRKSKVNFLHFNGGDPHEWLDKVEHYFQLAKLKQEGRVPVYIKEFHRLQILVNRWSKESLLGTFIEGLKPWLARELKLKQPQRLTEAMRIAEILEDSYYSDKKPFKENSGSNNFKSESNKDSRKGKGAIEDGSKKESKEVKKLTKEKVHERIKKGMCFKCEEKWNKDHRCRIGKVFMIIDSSDSDNDVISNEEATSDEGELMVAELGENNCVAELSLNAMYGISKPSTMRLMAWVGKFKVSMLVDSGSSHNFINTNIVRKIGLRGAAIEPFDMKVANGEKLKCEEVVHEVKMNVQRVRIAADLHVFSLVGVDVVLGNAWLKSIGKVVTYFDAMTIEFKLGGRKRTSTALPLKEIKQCEAQMIERLCKGGAQCFAVVNDGDRHKGKSENKNTNELQDELQRLPEKVREVAYKLELPFTSRLHPVFHVTVLKKRVGNPSIISSDLPAFDTEGNLLIRPVTALRDRNWKKGRGMTKVWQVLVQWQGVPTEEATWEDYDEMVERFPNFSLEDKGILEKRGNVETIRKSKRIVERRLGTVV